MKNEIEIILAEYTDGTQTLQEATTKVLRLFSVSSRREQLIDFLMEIDECHGMHVKAAAEKCVDEYLKSINCS